MTRFHEAGKGSKQRPGSGYADGWYEIWGEKTRWAKFKGFIKRLIGRFL